jgi:hypothetical protein
MKGILKLWLKTVILFKKDNTDSKDKNLKEAPNINCVTEWKST